MSPVQVMALQPVAVVDHVAWVRHAFLTDHVKEGEVGGSRRVDEFEMQQLLEKVESEGLETMGINENLNTKNTISTRAGGSAANTARGLAKGFGVKAGLLGAVGDDDWGDLFLNAMRRNDVDVSTLTTKPGKTGRCVCLVDPDGQRTMRTCLENAVRVDREQLQDCLTVGTEWLVVPGYAFYRDGLVEAAIAAAKNKKVKIALALASFEIVHKFKPQIGTLIKSGDIDIVFANEDEAFALVSGNDENVSEKQKMHDTFLETIVTCSPDSTAVCTLGALGCLARKGTETVSSNALHGFCVRDTTGAGDLFVSGFLAATLDENNSLQKCAELGCVAGAAATQCIGAEVSDEVWEWMRKVCVDG
tara:strand:- start:51720 stop:52802 length:1083 start_codon:yes stop_codon:yes gene_type:complete